MKTVFLRLSIFAVRRWLLGGLGLLALWLGTSLSARAQAPAWQSAAAVAGDVSIQATVAKGTYLYLAGSFSGTATLGGTTLSTANGRELFVAKWSTTTSSFVWAVQGNGSATTGTNQVAALAYNTTYGLFVAGSFSSASLTLGSAAALTNAQSGTTDIFLARLIDAGSTASIGSALRAGGAGNDYATTCVSSYFKVLVGGSTAGNASFGGIGGTLTLAGAGGFVAAYTYSLVPNSGDKVVPMGSGVQALTGAGSYVYATGTFNASAATFPTSGTATTTLSSAGGEDVFATKLYYYSLTPYWLTQAGGVGNDYGRALAVSGSSVYVSGSYGGTSATFGGTTLSGAGSGSLFVGKLTDGGSSASFAWATQSTGGTNAANSAYALATYGSSVYVAGTFGGSTSLGGSTLASAGSSDVLLAKLVDSGSSGAWVWGQRGGSTGPDTALGLARLGTTLYVAGQVSTPASFGSSQISTAAGARPGFVATLLDTAPLLTLAAPNTGTVGSVLTLYGAGLGGTTAIAFAGSNNNVVTSGFTVSADGTSISGVVVPAGAQTGTLNVITPLGSSNGLVSFTVLTTPNPAPAWQLQATTAGSSIRKTVADARGNLIVAGTFSGTITLGSTTLTARSSQEIFVAKWSTSSSSYVWAVRAAATYCSGLAVNGSSIYLGGYYTGTSIDLGTLTLANTTTGNTDGFVAKLTDAGSSASFVWATNIGGDTYEYVDALTVSGSSVYAGGDYGSATLKVGNSTLSSNSFNNDRGYIVKITDNGSAATVSWLTDAGSNSANFDASVDFYGLAVQGGTLYAAASFYGTASFGGTQLTSNSSSNDIVVARVSEATGAPAFTAAMLVGGSSIDFPTGMLAANSALYVYGYTYSSSLMTNGTTNLTNNGGSDALLLKLADNGTTGLGFVWGTLLGGTGTDYLEGLAASGNSLYAAGYFNSAAMRLGGSILANAGDYDGFVARLTDAGSSASVQWGQSSGGLGGEANYTVALSGGKVYVGGYVVPAAAFGPLAVAGPAGTQVATLASLADPLLPTAAPAAPAAARTLYPNPAHGTTTVQLPAGTSRLLLLDHLGRELRRQPVPAGASEVALDLGGLAQGLYLVRVLGSGPAATHRLQVE